MKTVILEEGNLLRLPAEWAEELGLNGVALSGKSSQFSVFGMWCRPQRGFECCAEYQDTGCL